MNGKMFQDGLCCIAFDKTAAKTNKKKLQQAFIHVCRCSLSSTETQIRDEIHLHTREPPYCKYTCSLRFFFDHPN